MLCLKRLTTSFNLIFSWKLTNIFFKSNIGIINNILKIGSYNEKINILLAYPKLLLWWAIL